MMKNPLEDQIRMLISRAIRQCKKGWPVVAAELSAAVGETITESTLHEFTRARHSVKKWKKLFPMDWVPALAAITSSHELEQFALCDDCRRALAIGKLGTAAMSQKLR